MSDNLRLLGEVCLCFGVVVAWAAPVTALCYLALTVSVPLFIAVFCVIQIVSLFAWVKVTE